LADKLICQIQRNLVGIYFGGRLNNEFVLGELNEFIWNKFKE